MEEAVATTVEEAIAEAEAEDILDPPHRTERDAVAAEVAETAIASVRDHTPLEDIIDPPKTASKTERNFIDRERKENIVKHRGH